MNDPGILRCTCGGAVRLDGDNGVLNPHEENRQAHEEYRCVSCGAHGRLTIYPDGSTRKGGCLT
jgi:hypothetical protein